MDRHYLYLSSERGAYCTVNPLLGPRGAFQTETILRRGEGLIWEGEGGLFNLAEKTMVPVLHKELGYKMKKRKYKKLEVMQPRMKNQFKLQVGE